MTKLAETEIVRCLAEVPQWSRSGEEITREFDLGGFGPAIAFVNRVAAFAEDEDHHPDILIQYSRVRLTLSTHDAGGLTEQDFALARRIDAAMLD